MPDKNESELQVFMFASKAEKEAHLLDTLI